MGTATISLKFISLAKIRSKCCLEIVPEVLNIQNIDKMKWKESLDSIEYSVPVTYKIVLKKVNTRDDNENVVRLFHSCVDLMPSCSNENLAYGDVSKNMSEYLIQRNLNKITAHVSGSKPIAINVTSKAVIQRKTAHNTEKTDKLQVKTHVARGAGTSISECLLCESVRKKTKNLPKVVNKIRTKNISTITDYVMPQTSSFNRKKLTIASVCKIDTYEDISKGSNLNSGSNKPLVRYKPIESKHKAEPMYMCLDDRQYRHKRKYFSLDYKNQNSYSFMQPNARIAYFKSVIEKEVLPLKIVLEDLVIKCANFGLLQSSIDSKKYLNYNNFMSHNCASFENKINCNRVVYSIVFDE